MTAVSITPVSGVSFFNRARFDGNDWTVKREEAGLNFGFGRLFASVRYLYEQSGLVQADCTTAQLQINLATDIAECPSPFNSKLLVPEGSSVIGEVENAEVNGSWFFTKHWGITANVTHDFIGYEINGKFKPVWPVAQLGFTYLDECMRLDLIYTHDETYSATIGPSNSIAFRLTLTTLGGTLGSPGARNSREGAR